MDDKRTLFREFAEACRRKNFIIGQGNPEAKILFIGKEPSRNVTNDYTFECLDELNGKTFEDLWQVHDKGSEGATWSKYQKTIDRVYPERKHTAGKLDFEEMAFCTEMNNVCSLHTATADKSTIADKRRLFHESGFIQSFPIVILACGDYIINQGDNRQIDDTFGVEYHQEAFPNRRPNYWIHYAKDSNKPKLVIHTRQLSGPLSNEFVFSIGDTIREFLMEHNDL